MIVQAESLRLPFADGVAHAVVTSPPYWGGVRVYSGAQGRLWPAISYSPMPGLPPVEIPAQTVALGHEPDPFAYIGHLLQVFRECRRALRGDGVLACNLGDCYSSSPSGQNGQGISTGLGRETHYRVDVSAGRADRRGCGVAPKNLLLMPWRLALAMQADGWILRSRMPGGTEMEPDLIWKKDSCMPSSVRDRPTVDFEDVLIFSQRPRYYWDQEAGREALTRMWGANNGPVGTNSLSAAKGGQRNPAVGRANPAGRNMRAVWTINPEPTDEEHYASFPGELAARLIAVTTSERGCCPECGASWDRVVERVKAGETCSARKLQSIADYNRGPDNYRYSRLGSEVSDQTSTLGWRAACLHPHDPIPCTVLDPFAGLGRTWEACKRTGRRFLGVDLALEYCRLALSRNDLVAMERRKAAESRGKTITGPLFDLPEQDRCT